MFQDHFFRDVEDTPEYHTYWIKDHNPLSGVSKKRHLCNPNAAMRRIQKKFIRYLRRRPLHMPSATAARQGDSALKNVLRHKIRKGNLAGQFPRYFYLADINSAYQNINLVRLAKILHQTDQRWENIIDTHSFLMRIYKSPIAPGIAVGSIGAGDLFNIYCEVEIDRPLRALCKKYGLRYTRYLDDLTFSSMRPIGRRKRQELLKVIRQAGFSLSHEKCQVLDLNKGPIFVNGIGIKRNGRIFLPRKALRQLRGMLHLAITGRKVNHRRLRGKMSMFRHLTDTQNPNKTEAKILEMYKTYTNAEC